jgi:hypothetical protein
VLASELEQIARDVLADARSGPGLFEVIRDFCERCSTKSEWVNIVLVTNLVARELGSHRVYEWKRRAVHEQQIVVEEEFWRPRLDSLRMRSDRLWRRLRGHRRREPADAEFRELAEVDSELAEAHSVLGSSFLREDRPLPAAQFSGWPAHVAGDHASDQMVRVRTPSRKELFLREQRKRYGASYRVTGESPISNPTFTTDVIVPLGLMLFTIWRSSPAKLGMSLVRRGPGGREEPSDREIAGYVHRIVESYFAPDLIKGLSVESLRRRLVSDKSYSIAKLKIAEETER